MSLALDTATRRSGRTGPSAATSNAGGPNSTLALASDVETLQKALERSFAQMTRTLPQMAGELDSLLTELRQSSAAESRSSLAELLERMRSAQADLSRSAGSVLDSNRQVTEMTDALAQSANWISRALTILDRVSIDLKLISLNASAAAHRAGRDAAAFAVLTRELTVIARTTASTVPVIQQSAEAIDRMSTDTVAARAELNGLVGDLSSGIERTGQATETSITILGSLQTSLAELAARAEEALAPIGAIMVASQRQDIVRQKMDHVLMALRELAPVTSRPDAEGLVSQRSSDEVLYQEKVARLCATLLADVREELDGLLADVTRNLHQLSTTSETLTTMQGAAGERAELSSSLAAPAEVLRALLDPLSQIRGALSSYAELVRVLHSHVGHLAREFDELDGFVLHLSSINVQVRMELARSETLATILTAPAEIARTAEVYKDLTSKARSELSSLVETTSSLGAIFNDILKEGERLDFLKEAASGHAERLASEAKVVAGSIERAMRLGGALGSTCTFFEKTLGEIRTSLTNAREVQQRCEDVSQKSRGKLLDLGIDPDAELSVDLGRKLSSIVDRFTVLRHKTAAQGITSVQTEAGDAPGTLTLF